MKNIKAWGRIALVLSMLCLTALFAGCLQTKPQEGTPTNTVSPTQQPTTEEPTTAEPPKVYEPNAEVFDSFADLKANLDLFADRIPCTLSTLGYHKKDDGGAATYQIVKVKPEGAFEKVADKVWAVIVHNGEVCPEQFGAKPDGITDNSLPISRAALYAAQHQVKLVLNEKDYSTYYPVTFSGINVQSNNAKISYHGMDANTAAVYVESNTNIYGTFNIWSVDNNLEQSGERCGLMFGKYAKESSVTDCYIENVVVTGGSKHTNAVFITGDSHDITIDRIYVPSGTVINRALLIHWGNANHYNVNFSTNPPTHTASAGATPTQHPHDIHIGVIECHDLLTFEGMNDGTSCAISLCGVYDIYVDEIILSNAMEVVHITSGDFGYQYAAGDLKKMTSRNICIDKITATGVTANVVYVAGRSYYKPVVDAWPEVHIKEIYAEAKGEKTRGLALHETALAEIGKMTLKGFADRGVSVTYETRKVVINEYNAIDPLGPVLVCDNRDDRNINTDVTVKSLNISGSTAYDFAAISLREVNGVRIESLSIKGCSFPSLLSLGSNVCNIRIDAFTCTEGAALTASVVNATVEITAANNVSLGHGLDGVALTSGESCAVSVSSDYEIVEPPKEEKDELYREKEGVGIFIAWADGKDL